ncbi:MAG: hypothetical protein NMK33_00970 [Candidatus Cardinium sp.]|uniref:hypothetical protein n=1 Tax=Cardinium endosymbiont of Dermatophagoides farinae TaxID=2597823 RepID=UPI0011827B6F|nr:hypothetical protein [Cardinium endosymbiont of Dermatophagoides farinae]TSJ81087.1 hypothetical protein FPG78_03660 [Cardinium endosymbiont of Dermatophagoides farinae]UWW97126.1 MAG: hypothetical protein NMK33_00970 [Candidatus Cardinium sp.]
MNLKKYSSYIFALLLCCGCFTNKYTDEEREGYYTWNPYKLGEVEPFKLILKPANEIIKFSKKLQDRIPKWCDTGQEKQLYAIWKDFFTQEIQPNITDQLKRTHNTHLLEDYYEQLGKLFKGPTAASEEALISASKALQADTKLIAAFEEAIAKRHAEPENICFIQPILEYQKFLYFILERYAKFDKLEESRYNLVKWKDAERPTGTDLWEKIEEKYKNLLENVQWYSVTVKRDGVKRSVNQESIKKCLMRIDDWAANKDLTYKDLLETIPHGIDLIRKILSEAALEEKEDAKLLKTYLGLFPIVCSEQLKAHW